MDDLFGDVPQPERPQPAEPRQPLTAEDVRTRMLELIAALQGAEAIPFAPAEYQRHVAMFPIMAQWLPQDEGEQLVLAFEAEVERLKKAA